MNPSQEQDAAERVPVVLLVEDEPVSLEYLQAALTALPARVLGAASAVEAVRLADTTPAALWMIDAHLPDASGLALLQRLRARAPATPALAHTAEPSPVLHARLREAGFQAVLIKPIAVAALHAAVRDALGAGDDATAAAAPRTAAGPSRVDDSVAVWPAGPLWDDASALRALNGNAAILSGMRSLFRTELAQSLPRIAALRETGAVDALRGELHKLKAATAFVGAAQLSDAVGLLATPGADDEQHSRAYAGFVAAAEAVLRAG